jgi:RNase P subunit RPR2
MNSDYARRFLQALRTGDKKIIAAFIRQKWLDWRIVCQHCNETVVPQVRAYDFEELEVSAECPSCGEMNRLPIKNWDSKTPLQWPPAT